MGNEWTLLKPVPISYVSSILQPIYVTHDDFKYILMLNDNSNEIIKYNLISKTYIKLKSVHNENIFSPSTACLDTAGNIIIAIDTYEHIGGILRIDDEKNQYLWEINSESSDENDESMVKKNVHTIGLQSTSCYLLNEMHIVGGESNNNYLKYNYQDSKLTTLHAFKDAFCLTNHGMIYVNCLKKIFVFGGLCANKYQDRLFVYDCVSSKVTKLDHVIMPRKMAKFGYVFYDNKFVIVLGGETNSGSHLDSIFVLDITSLQNNHPNHGQVEWQLNSIKCPIKSSFYSVITDDGYIHLFERDSDEHKHWFLSIEKLKLPFDPIKVTSNDIELVEEKQAELTIDNSQSSIIDIKNKQIDPYDFGKAEFMRFLEESLPKGKSYQSYLEKFEENELNDIRFVHALTAIELEEDIKMKKFHENFLLEKIHKYRTDHQRFEKKFEEICMYEKYYGCFDKNGIVSYWSFYHCIKKIDDIKKIAPHVNDDDLQILWLSLCKIDSNSPGNERPAEGAEQTAYI